MENIIDEFIESLYGKGDSSDVFGIYVLMREKAQQIISDRLKELGCKAIVTSRVKDKDSLERKLNKRNDSSKEKYKTFDDIYNDVFDFLGLRVSLYFPNDIPMVEEAIKRYFKIIGKPIIFPQKNKQKNTPSKCPEQENYTKIFPGYSAVHYRVSLKQDLLETINPHNYPINPVFEIQVISLVLHAWAEVEHDIVYKPNYKKLSKEVHKTLDEINGLMQLGEMAFVRLKDELVKGIIENNEVSDQYELSAYISQNVPKEESELHSIGNMKYLFELIKSKEEKITKYDVDKMIEKAQYGKSKFLAGEFVINLMIESPVYYEQYCIHRSNIENQELINEYRELIKRYSVLLHTAFKKGDEIGVFEELKNKEDNENALLDYLLARLLDISTDDASWFRDEIYQVGNNKKYQRQAGIDQLKTKIKKYQKKISGNKK